MGTSIDEDEGNYSEEDEAFQGSVLRKFTKVDLTLERPVEESLLSLKEAKKLCQTIPTDVDAQGTTTLALLIKVVDSAGEILPILFQFPHFGWCWCSMRSGDRRSELCTCTKLCT